MEVCDQFVGHVVGQGKMKAKDMGGKRKSNLCVEDVVVLSTFVDCVGNVDGLGSSVNAWV